jgi:hypothetical protein
MMPPLEENPSIITAAPVPAPVQFLEQGMRYDWSIVSVAPRITWETIRYGRH